MAMCCCCWHGTARSLTVYVSSSVPVTVICEKNDGTWIHATCMEVRAAVVQYVSSLLIFVFSRDAGAAVGYATVDNYESMLKVLREMSDEDKERLVARVQELVGSSSLEALTSFIASQVNRELFATAVREFASRVKSGG